MAVEGGAEAQLCELGTDGAASLLHHLPSSQRESFTWSPFALWSQVPLGGAGKSLKSHPDMPGL